MLSEKLIKVFNIFIVLSGFVLNSCHSQYVWTYNYVPAPAPAPVPAIWTRPITSLEYMVDNTNDFCYKYLNYHSRSNRNNFAFSPSALSSVMIAVYEGSIDTCGNEIRDAMSLPYNLDILRIGFRDVHRRLRVYFFNKENPLSCLNLNKENVTITPEYESVLEFYGYDLGPSMIGSRIDIPTTTMSIETTTILSTTEPVVTSTIPAETTPEVTTTEETTEEATEPTTSTEAVTTMAPTTIEPATTPTSTVTPTTVPTTTTPETTVPTTTSPATTVAATEPPTTTPVVTTEAKDETTVTEASTKPATEPVTEPATETATEAATEATTSPTTPTKETTLATTEGVSTDITTSGTTDEATTEGTTPVTTEEATTDGTTPVTTTEEVTTVPTTIESETEDTTPTATPPDSSTIRLLKLRKVKSEKDNRIKRDIFDSYFGQPTYSFPILSRGPVFEYQIPSVQQVYFQPRSLPTQNEIQHIFYLNPRDTIQTKYKIFNGPMKHAYLSSLKATALDLDLNSKNYNLMLMIPDNPFQLDGLVASLNEAPSLRKIRSAMMPKTVQAIIPDFKMNGRVVLTNALQDMGISKIFEPRTECLRPMTNEKNIYVKHIEQVINLNIKTKSMNQLRRNVGPFVQPIELSVNHPFLFFVMDKELDLAILAGRVMNPMNVRITK